MKSKFTGMCRCGHGWSHHHHSMILNSQALKDIKQGFRDVDGLLGDECQFGTCGCSTYWDKKWNKKKE